ncbi:hypothetical protein Pcinc_010462 [Petrolisthes cinctipes]|uniref:Uncharacterized protein n=1 Tax=Petrolisthes cinctipes TaxID=88211 RepID=A0AAE1KUH1_PETCI|nr:hypothetical protein Pcinc_010462 [Petrolisthes cinctipes]
MLGVTGDVTRVLDLGSADLKLTSSVSSKLTSAATSPLLLTDTHQQRLNEAPKKIVNVYGDERSLNQSDRIIIETHVPKVVTTTKSVRLRSANTKHRMVLAVVCCGNRVNETMTMLKSAATLSHSPLKIIVFTEDDLKPIFRNMYTSWPADVSERITLDLHSITFPADQDAAAWRKLFKPCASQRLFMPLGYQATSSTQHTHP